MKSKLLVVAATMLLFGGCSNETIDQELSESVIREEILNMDFPFNGRNLASLDHIYTVVVLKKDGTETDISSILHPLDNIQDSCKTELKYSDIENTATFPTKLFVSANYWISNANKVNEIRSCAYSYLKTTQLDYLSSQYLFGDKRVASNLHYDFLKKAMSDAVKDDKVTYSEAYNIYWNLDKALALNVKTNIEENTKKAKETTKLESTATLEASSQ